MEDKNLIVDFRDIFLTESQKIAIYLFSSKIKSTGYDPFRNTGQETEQRNAIYKKAIVRQFTPEKLIYREMGLALSNSVELIMKTSDVGFIKLAEEIIIKGKSYVTFNEALGNKCLIFERPYNFSRVILFSQEDKNVNS